MKPRSAFGQLTLARQYFTSGAIYAQEQEHIFGSSWLLAGHIGQLPAPGSYFLFELGDASVIVLRDRADGSVRAFHNHCRHRGSRLCQAPAGELGELLRCPYHAWAYGLDGSLRAAPNMAEVAGFERGAWPLHPVALAQHEGLLFVNLAPQPAQSLHAALPGLAGRFGPWQLADLLPVHHTSYEVAANWKLFFHNYSECYHCPGVHPQLNRLTPFRNTENDLDAGPMLGGPMWMSDPDGSMTMHGARIAAPLPGLSAVERGRVYYYTLFPGAFLSLHPDYLLIHQARPLAIDRTRIDCRWFCHRDAIATPGFDPAAAIEFWDLTNRQDWELCANAQLGVSSAAWQPGPYAELESQLAAFDRHYLEVMGAAGQ